MRTTTNDASVLDDFESHKAVNPAIARRKLMYVREEAFGALPKNKGRIIWLGNLTHADSALALFKAACENENMNDHIRFLLYTAIVESPALPAKDGKQFCPSGPSRPSAMEPLWPEAYSLADLAAMEKSMGSLGFQRHMMMNPIVEGVKFKLDWLRFYHDAPRHFDRIITYCDPSLSGKATADYKAIITLGLSTCHSALDAESSSAFHLTGEGRYPVSQKPLYYLLDCYVRKVSLNAMLKYLYALDRRFTTRIFMEANLRQKIIWEFIPPLAESEGYLLPVTGIENRIPKDQRIEALTPLFEWGWILFPENKSADQKLLEEQLLSWPDHPHDDAPDALAGAIAQLKNFAYKPEYRGTRNAGLANRFSQLW